MRRAGRWWTWIAKDHARREARVSVAFTPGRVQRAFARAIKIERYATGCRDARVAAALHTLELVHRAEVLAPVPRALLEFAACGVAELYGGGTARGRRGRYRSGAQRQSRAIIGLQYASTHAVAQARELRVLQCRKRLVRRPGRRLVESGGRLSVDHPLGRRRQREAGKMRREPAGRHRHRLGEEKRKRKRGRRPPADRSGACVS